MCILDGGRGGVWPHDRYNGGDEAFLWRQQVMSRVIGGGWCDVAGGVGEGGTW